MFRSEMFFGFLIVLAFVATLTGSSAPFGLPTDLSSSEPEFLRPLSSIELLNRLDGNVVPTNYVLKITPIIEGGAEAEIFTAPGEVKITVDCVTATTTVKLNAKNIQFTEEDVTIVDGDDVPVDVESILNDQETTETVTLNVPSGLVAGSTYEITINFVSQVNDGTSGLYRSSYDLENGETKYLATTQFEQTGARHAFPCFDEPALRATFDIRIGRNREMVEYHTLSNMPKSDPQPTPEEAVPGLEGYFYDYFQQTPPMSTYLIAIIVSDFTPVPAANDALVTVWGPSNRMIHPVTGVNNGQYSADAASRIQSFFKSYFKHADVPEDLTIKLDSAAIPDFSPGAMENWGLNTYRLSRLLFVEDDMTRQELWSIAAVLAHEIAHQWFGNIVTIKWWNDYYLKEGFARYLQFLGVAGTDTTFDALDRIPVDTIQKAMLFDVTPATHPIWEDVTDVAGDQNSRIIYEKAASVIRMMEGFLNEVRDPVDSNGATDTVLRRALVRYLAAHNDAGYATQEDLYAALQAEVDASNVPLENKSIKEIMDTWTTQSGYPLVRVSSVSSTIMYVSQEKYVADINVRNAGVEAAFWEIPISYVTQKEIAGEEENPGALPENYRPANWLGVDKTITSVEADTSGWILVNPEAKAYYRVLYDKDLYDKLLLQFNGQNPDHSVIPVASRSQLLDDYFNFAFDRYEDIERALEFTNYLDRETERSVWITAMTHFRKIYNHMRNPGSVHFEALKNHLIAKIRQQFVLLTNLNTYTSVQLMLKSILMEWMCMLDTQECTDETTAVLDPWESDPPERTHLYADIMFSAFCRGYEEEATAQPWRQLIHDRYEPKLVVPTNYNAWLYRARGCHPDATTLPGLLMGTIDQMSDDPRDHRKSLIDQIAGRTDGFAPVMAFLNNMENTLLIISELGDDTISAAIATLSTHASTVEQQAEVQAYYDLMTGVLPENILTSINSSIAAIQLNRDWNTEFGYRVGCYLDPTTC